MDLHQGRRAVPDAQLRRRYELRQRIPPRRCSDAPAACSASRRPPRGPAPRARCRAPDSTADRRAVAKSQSDHAGIPHLLVAAAPAPKPTRRAAAAACCRNTAARLQVASESLLRSFRSCSLEKSSCRYPATANAAQPAAQRHKCRLFVNYPIMHRPCRRLIVKRNVRSGQGGP